MSARSSTPTLSSLELAIANLDCADCAAKVEAAVRRLPGVGAASLTFATGKLHLEYDAAEVSPSAIEGVIQQFGYEAEPLSERARPAPERPFWLRNRRALFTAGSGLFLVLGYAVLLLSLPAIYAQALFAAGIVVGGFQVARAGLFSIIRARNVDMNVLMSLAVLGAIAIGQWEEAATVVFLFALGNALESYTMDRARSAVRALMEQAPAQARVKRGRSEVMVPADEVQVGEVVAVRPGERVPVDGRVVAGASSVNQAPVTGESLAVEKAEGDEVYAGTVNEQGYLEIVASKPYADNTIARIARLVEQAQAQRAPSQRFVDSFARYYTPTVIAIATGVAVLPWWLWGLPFDAWFYRALVLLVIACPCALVISTPVSIVSGLARAARLGVLVKGGAYLEEAGALKVVAFDKTGTLTVGRPEVTDVIPLNGRSAEEVLQLAATVERRSEHPLAAAVLRRVDRRQHDHGGHECDHDHGHEQRTDYERAHHCALPNCPTPQEEHAHEVADFEAVLGKGVRARIDGAPYYVGSPRLFEELGIDLAAAAGPVDRLRAEGKTVLLLGDERQVVGLLGLADRLRPDARRAVESLRQAGIARIVLLTGDHEVTARAIAREVGIDEYRAGLLPEDKVAAVKELQARYGQVAMVGDGINDAHSLAAANVGIAMGTAGTDAALETADIALMSDELEKVAFAIGLSQRTLGTVRQNIGLSLLIKGTFLALAVAGFVTLWAAIAADMGASLLVTLNGMRLLGYRGR